MLLLNLQLEILPGLEELLKLAPLMRTALVQGQLVILQILPPLTLDAHAMSRADTSGSTELAVKSTAFRI